MAELPYNDSSVLMSNDSEFGLIDINTGETISKELGPRFNAENSASGVIHYQLNSSDSCNSVYDLTRGSLQLGLPGVAKPIPVSIRGQSISSFIAVPTSSIALVGATTSSGECQIYGRLYAVDLSSDVLSGNVLSEVLDSYRDGRSVALSPNGKLVAYTEKGKLYIKPTTGGAATLAHSASSHVDGAPAWSSDGALWFATDMKPANGDGKAWLWRRSGTGELSVLTRID